MGCIAKNGENIHEKVRDMGCEKRKTVILDADWCNNCKQNTMNRVGKIYVYCTKCGEQK